MVGIVLQKGGKIDLSKQGNLTRILVGLRWAENKFSGADFDLDASVFICKNDKNKDAKLISDEYFIFYNQLVSPDGAVKHNGDDKVGGTGNDDCETIEIDLSKLSPLVDELSFIVTIHDAQTRKQNFGQVSKSRITLTDLDTGEMIAEYNLEEAFYEETAVQFGSIYKYNGKWMFKAVGGGYKLGLADFVKGYGGNLA